MSGLNCSQDLSEIMDFIRPRKTVAPLLRVGGSSDGAYLLPDVLSDVDACFSPGCCNTKTFEDELLYRFEIKSYLCDYTSDVEKFKTPFVEGKQHFLKKWLSPKQNADCISLDAWVTGSDAKGNLILQMDIEGAEYENLRSASADVLGRFSVLIIEFHWSEDAFASGHVADHVSDAFRKLMPLFTCVHFHPNNCCGSFLLPELNRLVPRVFECTFLRKDVFRSVGVVPEELSSLPNSQDISFNVPSRRPMIPAEGWGATHPDAGSVWRGFEISLDYTEARAGKLEGQLRDLEARLQRAERDLREIHLLIRAWSWCKRIVKRTSRFFRIGGKT
jgi:hypothetical protein